MQNYYQREIETMPYDQLRQLQNERLRKQVQHVWDNVPYYRKKMEEKNFLEMQTPILTASRYCCLAVLRAVSLLE